MYLTSKWGIPEHRDDPDNRRFNFENLFMKN